MGWFTLLAASAALWASWLTVVAGAWVAVTSSALSGLLLAMLGAGGSFMLGAWLRWLAGEHR